MLLREPRGAGNGPAAASTATASPCSPRPRPSPNRNLLPNFPGLPPSLGRSAWPGPRCCARTRVGNRVRWSGGFVLQSAAWGRAALVVPSSQRDCTHATHSQDHSAPAGDPPARGLAAGGIRAGAAPTRPRYCLGKGPGPRAASRRRGQTGPVSHSPSLLCPLTYRLSPIFVYDT